MGSPEPFTEQELLLGVDAGHDRLFCEEDDPLQAKDEDSLLDESSQERSPFTPMVLETAIGSRPAVRTAMEAALAYARHLTGRNIAVDSQGDPLSSDHRVLPLSTPSDSPSLSLPLPRRSPRTGHAKANYAIVARRRRAHRAHPGDLKPGGIPLSAKELSTDFEGESEGDTSQREQSTVRNLRSSSRRTASGNDSSRNRPVGNYATSSPVAYSRAEQTTTPARSNRQGDPNSPATPLKFSAFDAGESGNLFSPESMPCARTSSRHRGRNLLELASSDADISDRQAKRIRVRITPKKRRLHG